VLLSAERRHDSAALVFLHLDLRPDKQFRTDTVTVDLSWGEGLDGAEAARASFLRMLVTRKPLVIHEVEDEVTMARLCERLWPGERVTKLRQAVEDEYRARGI
jgi:hypothetical protein